MTERLQVASRKGLLTFAPDGRGWRLAASSFLGDPVSAVLADDRDGTLYAALALGHFGVKLHRSEDGGTTWRELPAPAYPANGAADGGADEAPSVALIWSLAAGGADQPGRLWAGTIPGGLFRSDDRGESWTLVESLWNEPSRKEWFGGGYDQPGIHSVCVDSRESRRLTLGVSCGGIWLSDDDGASWRVGKGLRNAYMPPERAYDPVVQDPHRLAQCQSAPDTIWCQHHNGIFRSDDRGESFIEIEAEAPSRFGFAVAVHPEAPRTAWFVPAVKDECRVPVDGRLVVTRTRDGGESFEVLSEGLPERDCYDLIYRHGLAVDSAGERLAMGSTTGNLWLGEAGGTRWSLLARHLPPIAQVMWG
ncbi:MAG TPA: hypothetical protein VLL72_02470 [Kiloniellales bacterium]|nr:hypothetical protein [Kiloniellales bacterium]